MLLTICVLLGSVLLDQLSKYLVLTYLAPVGSVPLWEGVFHFTYVENTGAAFGMLKDHRWVFLLISTVGRLPGILLAVLGGAAVGARDPLLIALFFVLLLALAVPLAILYKKNKQATGNKQEGTNEDD